MKYFKKFPLQLAIVLAAMTLAGTSDAQVPLRISIKFILDANGNRPATGSLNTDAEINAEVKSAIDILAGAYTEFSVDQIEFVDLSGLSQWYSTSAATTAGRDAIRNAAIAAPATYHWRNDAINIYINGGTSSAISDFPPNNNMILMNQGCGNTPSCVLHEMGHSLNLMHTHETVATYGDACADTLTDNSGWTKDQLASNNFSCTYANCTASQKAAVDLTFNNVMSYHTSEPQLRLSPCQMDRISTQAYSNRNWMLSKQPVYVNNNVLIFFPNGSFGSPYTSITSGFNAVSSNNVLVLQQGDYAMGRELVNTSPYPYFDIVTRSGPSSFHQGVQNYILPFDIENSKHPNVRSNARVIQNEDSQARSIDRDAENAAKKATKAVDRELIRADAKARRQVHHDNAMKGLLDAEKYAENNEKLAIQLELAQRYRDSGDCVTAIQYFKKVAETTDQPGLKHEALTQIERCSKKQSPTNGQ